MTPEQKFLQAIAELTMNPSIENEEAFVEASKEYLDQFREVKEKVESAWKPEVGKLYRRKLNGVITEVIKAFLDNREFSKVAHKLIGVNYDTCHAHCDYASGFLEEYEPIAELEGLKSGDTIWCIAGSGVTEYYTIESVFSNNLTAYCGKGYVSVYFDGSACMFGNGKQLFWRTADRAERFGRG